MEKPFYNIFAVWSVELMAELTRRIERDMKAGKIRFEPAIKNGLIGTLDEDLPFVSYCNEKTPERGVLLFKCNDECIHAIRNEAR